MEVYNNQQDHEGLQTRVQDDGMYAAQPHGHPGQYRPQDKSLYTPYPQDGSPQHPAMKIFGLRRTTFWLVLLLLFILIAAVVGGTVGGVLGSRGANSSSAASVTTTISVSTPAAPTSTTASISAIQPISASKTSSGPTLTATHPGTASLPSASSSAVRGGCPVNSGSKWVSGSGYNTFAVYCGTDFPVNDLLNGAYISVDTFDACMEFCADLNDKRNFTLCFGVSFVWNSSPGRACFLKNPAIDVASQQTVNVDTDSGIIVL